MPKQIKFSKKPGATGAVMSLLLTVSFFLPRIWDGNTTVGSINTVVIVAILCLAARLVLETSHLYGEHLWSNKIFLLLMSVPAFNIIATALQLVLPDARFMLHPVFLTLLVIASLPAFYCYYFTAMWLNFKKNRHIAVTTIIVDLAGLIYILIRLFDKVIIPALSLQGNEINAIADKLFSLSPWFSLVVYILSFVNFIICAREFGETDEITD